MNIKVKICGVRTINTAQIAINHGADYIGFNFVAPSRRYIDPKSAKTIISNISNKIQIVGVFQDQTLSYVNGLVDYLSLDFVQLHGKEDINYIKKVKARVIKTVHVDSKTYQELSKHISFFLLDRKYQGRGKSVSFEKAKNLSQSLPFFIAGGLTPLNVDRVIRVIKPYGVDVAGGIETDDKQDERKIVNFIKNVKAIKL